MIGTLNSGSVASPSASEIPFSGSSTDDGDLNQNIANKRRNNDNDKNNDNKNNDNKNNDYKNHDVKDNDNRNELTNVAKCNDNRHLPHHESRSVDALVEEGVDDDVAPKSPTPNKDRKGRIEKPAASFYGSSGESGGGGGGGDGGGGEDKADEVEGELRRRRRVAEQRRRELHKQESGKIGLARFCN